MTEKKNRTIHYSFKATPEEDAIITSNSVTVNFASFQSHFGGRNSVQGVQDIYLDVFYVIHTHLPSSNATI